MIWSWLLELAVAIDYGCSFIIVFDIPLLIMIIKDKVGHS